MRSSLLLPMCAVSVCCQSVRKYVCHECTEWPRIVKRTWDSASLCGSLGAVFAKLIWPLDSVFKDTTLTVLCCQELPSGKWLRFIGRIFRRLPTFVSIHSSYRVHSWYGKTKWLGYNLVKVAWWSTQSFGHNTSTWRTHRQPRRHSKCRANALRRAAKIM